jgi:hypothetical protein
MRCVPESVRVTRDKRSLMVCTYQSRIWLSRKKKVGLFEFNRDANITIFFMQTPGGGPGKAYGRVR